MATFKDNRWPEQSVTNKNYAVVCAVFVSLPSFAVPRRLAGT
jgi:hypothetical protein